MNSFSYANYNYCPLVRNFLPKNAINKTERIQYRALQFLHNDYGSDYNGLLRKPGKCSMEAQRLRTITVEIIESLNDLNPSFMKNLFNKRNNINSKKWPCNLYTKFRKVWK